MSFPWDTLGKRGFGRNVGAAVSELLSSLSPWWQMGGSQELQQFRVRCDFFWLAFKELQRRSLDHSWLGFPGGSASPGQAHTDPLPA